MRASFVVVAALQAPPLCWGFWNTGSGNEFMAKRPTAASEPVAAGAGEADVPLPMKAKASCTLTAADSDCAGEQAFLEGREAGAATEEVGAVPTGPDGRELVGASPGETFLQTVEPLSGLLGTWLVNTFVAMFVGAASQFTTSVGVRLAQMARESFKDVVMSAVQSRWEKSGGYLEGALGAHEQRFLYDILEYNAPGANLIVNDWIAVRGMLMFTYLAGQLRTELGPLGKALEESAKAVSASEQPAAADTGGPAGGAGASASLLQREKNEVETVDHDAEPNGRAWIVEHPDTVERAEPEVALTEMDPAQLLGQPAHLIGHVASAIGEDMAHHLHRALIALIIVQSVGGIDAAHELGAGAPDSLRKALSWWTEESAKTQRKVADQLQNDYHKQANWDSTKLLKPLLEWFCGTVVYRHAQEAQCSKDRSEWNAGGPHALFYVEMHRRALEQKERKSTDPPLDESEVLEDWEIKSLKELTRREGNGNQKLIDLEKVRWSTCPAEESREFFDAAMYLRERCKKYTKSMAEEAQKIFERFQNLHEAFRIFSQDSVAKAGNAADARSLFDDLKYLDDFQKNSFHLPTHRSSSFLQQKEPVTALLGAFAVNTFIHMLLGGVTQFTVSAGARLLHLAGESCKDVTMHAVDSRWEKSGGYLEGALRKHEELFLADVWNPEYKAPGANLIMNLWITVREQLMFTHLGKLHKDLEPFREALLEGAKAFQNQESGQLCGGAAASLLQRNEDEVGIVEGQTEPNGRAVVVQRSDTVEEAEPGVAFSELLPQADLGHLVGYVASEFAGEMRGHVQRSLIALIVVQGLGGIDAAHQLGTAAVDKLAEIAKAVMSSNNEHDTESDPPVTELTRKTNLASGDYVLQDLQNLPSAAETLRLDYIKKKDFESTEVLGPHLEWFCKEVKRHAREAQCSKDKNATPDNVKFYEEMHKRAVAQSKLVFTLPGEVKESEKLSPEEQKWLLKLSKTETSLFSPPNPNAFNPEKVNEWSWRCPPPRQEYVKEFDASEYLYRRCQLYTRKMAEQAQKTFKSFDKLSDAFRKYSEAVNGKPRHTRPEIEQARREKEAQEAEAEKKKSWIAGALHSLMPDFKDWTTGEVTMKALDGKGQVIAWSREEVEKRKEEAENYKDQ